MTARISRRVASGTLAVLALGMLASACGDDDGKNAAAYTDAGNTLCDHTAEEVEAALPDFESEPTIEQVMDLAVDLEPVLVRWRDGVSDLDPPDDLQEKHGRLLDALDTAIEQTHTAATTEAGARALLDAGGPPLDAPGTAAHALFERCPAGD